MRGEAEVNTGRQIRAFLRDWSLVILAVLWGIGMRTDAYWPMFVWFVCDCAYCLIWDARHGRKFHW